MALRSRYQNYGHYPQPSADSGLSNSTSSEGELNLRPGHHLVSSNSSLPAVHASDGQEPHSLQEPHGRHSCTTGNRMDYIVNAMAYIRGELDDLKESDRVLLEIFKQLESNVAELSDSISTWRMNNTPGRPSSLFTDLDFNTPRSSYCMNSPRHSVGGAEPVLHGTETFLYSSKEDVSYRTSNESDSFSLLEHENSRSGSPVLVSRASSGSIGASSSSNGLPPKRPANPSPPQLKTSTSFNNRLANSPSITRLQDETSSNMSRNSSIDSGIQFASEAENGSANGVEVMQSTAVEQSHTTTDLQTTELQTTELQTAETTDLRKSVGFADDIFSALGLK